MMDPHEEQRLERRGFLRTPLARVAVAVLAGAMLLWGLSRASRNADAATYRLQREALRREAVGRATVARGLAGAPGSDEAGAVVRWWLEASGALRARYPQAAEAAAAERPAPARGTPAEAEAWKGYLADRVRALRDGYAPALGAVDQGLRLDLLSIKAAEHPETHERALRIDFALWGAPRRLDAEQGAARSALRVVVPLAFRQLGFRFVDEGGKPYGEMNGSGEPYRLIKDPEALSDDLVPGVALGTWWVEPFPREAARVEITVLAQVQGQGSGALTPTFRWEVPVQEDWKLRPGEAFKAEVREVVQEPPAGGAKPAPRK